MTKKWVLVLGVSAIALSIVYLLVLKPSDEARIRARLSEVSIAVRIDGAEVASGLRARRIQAVFADVFSRDVSVELGDLGTFDGDALLALAISAGDGLTSLGLEFGEAAVTMDRSKRTATVSTHGILRAGAPDGQMRQEEQDLRLRFEKVDGDWKITRISPAPG